MFGPGTGGNIIQTIGAIGTTCNGWVGVGFLAYSIYMPVGRILFVSFCIFLSDSLSFATYQFSLSIARVPIISPSLATDPWNVFLVSLLFSHYCDMANISLVHVSVSLDVSNL